MDERRFDWKHTEEVGSRSYVCGHCGKNVGPDKGYTAGPGVCIFLCSYCTRPTFFDDAVESQIPGPLVGDRINHLPADVEALYNEARACVTVSAFTPAVLACRKLLMHIAVEKGAEEGKQFAYYVGYLNEKHFIPPDGKGWVDYIRKRGNETNHQIILMDKQDATALITFAGMLMKFIYELPKSVPGAPDS